MFATRGAINPPVLSINTGLNGDSLTRLDGETPFQWTNGILGGRLKLIANVGVGSSTLGDALDRIDNAYTATPPGYAGLVAPGVSFTRTGTNNVVLGHSLASMQAGYDELAARTLGYFDKMVYLAVPPQGSLSLPQEYNGYLATLCAANPSRLLFIDDCAAMRTGNVQDSTFFSDGIHFNGKGVLTAGRAAAAHAGLQAWLAPYATATLISDAADVYPATPQWVPNPLMSGTGGSKGSGISGQVADSWAVAQTGGLAVTCSKVTGGWQRFALTAGASSSTLDITATLAGRTITTTDPAACELLVEFRFNALDTTGLGNFAIQVTHSDGGNLCPPVFLSCYDAGILTESSVIVRTAMPRDNAATHADAILQIHCVGGANPASPGSFDVRCASVRG